MQSLQQQPAKGQQVPPPVLIDGVSEQQIDDAVKAHVKGKRAATQVSARPGPEVRGIAMIDIALDFVERSLNTLDVEVQKDVSEGESNIGSSFWSVIELGQREIRRIRALAPKNFDEYEEQFRFVAGLCTCMAASYDAENTYAARSVKRLAGDIEVLYALVEEEASK